MRSFIEYTKKIKSLTEEISSVDVAPVQTNILKKVKKKKKPALVNSLKERIETPDDILRDNGIKVKSSDMDDSSYVILLFKKDDIKVAKSMLEKEGYEVSVVGKLLYIS